MTSRGGPVLGIATMVAAVVFGALVAQPGLAETAPAPSASPVPAVVTPSPAPTAEARVKPARRDDAAFVSRALVAVGLPESVRTTSSRSLRKELLALGAIERPDSAEARAQVAVGDLVQLDRAPKADDPRDRDRTGIVTAVLPEPDGSTTLRVLMRDGSASGSTLGAVLHRNPGAAVWFLHLP